MRRLLGGLQAASAWKLDDATNLPTVGSNLQARPMAGCICQRTGGICPVLCSGWKQLGAGAASSYLVRDIAWICYHRHPRTWPLRSGALGWHDSHAGSLWTYRSHAAAAGMARPVEHAAKDPGRRFSGRRLRFAATSATAVASLGRRWASHQSPDGSGLRCLGRSVFIGHCRSVAMDLRHIQRQCRNRKSVAHHARFRHGRSAPVELVPKGVGAQSEVGAHTPAGIFYSRCYR